MRSPTILGLLFIALCHPSFAQKAEQGEVRVAEGSPLVVQCPLRVEQRAQWRRDGGALPADLRPAGEAPAAGGGGAVVARLHAAAARAHHAGVYTCARGADAARVRVLVLPRPARPAGTEAAQAAPAAPTTAPLDEPPEWLDYVYELHRAIELDCKPGGGAEVPAGSAFTWQANGTDAGAAPALAGRHELREGGAVLFVARSGEEDWGNYTCALHGAAVRGFRVSARPVLRLPADSNVVEGQKLKLTCRVLGRPYPEVTWTFAAEAGVNETEVTALLGERVALRTSAAGVPRGELVIEAAQRGDAGVYTCRAPAGPPAGLPAAAPAGPPADPPAAATLLRVKDMYAALWPFLGICAEVFILCAIILVYEKRRTKPELDDSDTDNHDQKES